MKAGVVDRYTGTLGTTHISWQQRQQVFNAVTRKHTPEVIIKGLALVPREFSARNTKVVPRFGGVATVPGKEDRNGGPHWIIKAFGSHPGAVEQVGHWCEGQVPGRITGPGAQGGESSTIRLFPFGWFGLLDQQANERVDGVFLFWCVNGFKHERLGFGGCSRHALRLSWF